MHFNENYLSYDGGQTDYLNLYFQIKKLILK